MNLADVPSFFRQLDFDAMHVHDPLKAGVTDYYNTDEGVKFRAGHRMRSKDA
ncbi:hypothetical protein PIB30_078778, partial [Stylosanthes scabra]|nr:hypothetical protein [Stylosanthes scabra]